MTTPHWTARPEDESASGEGSASTDTPAGTGEKPVDPDAAALADTEEPESAAAVDDSDDDDDRERVPRVIPLQGIDPQVMAQGIAGFEDLPIHERLRAAVTAIGWKEPTAVQKLCLPYTLRGRDVAGFAQTGTGKTGVFLLTIVNRLLEAKAAGAQAGEAVTRAIVLAPTRELAMQIEQDAQVMCEHTGLTSLAVFGGIDYDKQLRSIKDGVDLIVATPGRLMDYVRKKAVDLKKIEVFVCDEADRMFDMGFIDDVEFFLERIPETAQKLLFSATTNEQVKELAFEYLESPEYISVTPEKLTPEKIVQHAIHVHAKDKLKVMLGLLRDHTPGCAIIFTNTKLTAEWLHAKLVGNGFDVDLITGDLPQKKRIKLIHRIKEGGLKALIATDVASRGLHISMVTHVYNFDLPDDPSNYVHRVGRTARAGASGLAYSLVCDDYGQNLAGINALLGEGMHLKSEWFDESYLSIEDKAGDPFKGRWRHDRPARPSEEELERGRARGGRDGGRGRDGGGRGREGGREGGRGREGPREGGRGREHDRDRKGAFGGGDRPQQSRHGGGGDRNRDRDRQHGQQGGQQGPQGEGGRRRRRGRGKGGEGQHDQQHGGQRHDAESGRHQKHDRNRQQASAKTRTDLQGEAPKTFVGMIKKFFRTLFGRK